MVLVGRIEDLEAENALKDLRIEFLERDLKAVQRGWFEKVMGDPRVWFIFGAYMGVRAVD